MGFQPPKGVRPPQLEGKRTGRPRGSKNFANAWRDLEWGYEHRGDDAPAPTAAAAMWRDFAGRFPDEVRDWLEAGGVLEEEDRPDGMEGLLEAIRWVGTHGEQADRTQMHRHFRELLKRSPRAFSLTMIRLENEVRKLHERAEAKQRKKVEGYRAYRGNWA